MNTKRTFLILTLCLLANFHRLSSAVKARKAHSDNLEKVKSRAKIRPQNSTPYNTKSASHTRNQHSNAYKKEKSRSSGDKIYTIKEKKKALIKIRDNLIGYLLNTVPKEIKDIRIKISTQEQAISTLDKKYINIALLAMFVIGCNMALYGVEYKTFNAFVLVWYYLFKTVYHQITEIKNMPWINIVLGNVLFEKICKYTSNNNNSMAISSVMCLLLAVGLCWFINISFRMIVLGSVLSLSLYVMQIVDLWSIGAERGLGALIFLVVFVLIFYKFLHKNVERYMFIAIFAFFSSVLIFLSLSEILLLGFVIPAIVLNYTTDAKESNISLNMEFFSLGVIMLVSCGMQVYKTYKKK
ncbi:hypothetical protein NEPAR06_1176 [Nematocida parisii]|uniref:Uncharacterized protein n=1 Tax=Nematocida parisii (strain ERTm3) TaxID=935791 RepID=I3EKP4_NEMP3|nr:uncharacterized protein NEPG_00671 [Nematocida parisii ERTm1]EIJ89791.1 hypothetical protein NEQG_00561 [Nematocida parisii ERTm3]KAI5128542.1 hypothetical protein NEPAR08_1300 [Nematocida parisii]EIJ94006.1 hypothetical protein NEPG_00671 [Nematocida parisii ERTm1]KAI5128573.1 hypothetical protein NEPAR03_1380 [Nematocida parisii]KAI5141871.1 hypothetical protein NEPAR04_1254 [Nematocida parisii]|eukprot:XP_013058502.1 hypothetical protein NEPG_00671 [Nematocida parisii ERTm1]